jgi:hypothetical protein
LAVDLYAGRVAAERRRIETQFLVSAVESLVPEDLVKSGVVLRVISVTPRIVLT